MRLETFFEKFDLFADTADAVENMRELVLRMATSGRITEQDSADQPGSEVLNEIARVRDHLISRGEAKSRTEGNPIPAGDTIDLPPSWARCMISEVCDLQTGATPSRMEHSYFGGDIPWLVSGDINRREITGCDGRITKEGLENSNCKVIPANSVLIALNGQGKTRATVAVLRIPAALNQSLVAMIPYSRELLLPEYIFWNLRGRYYAIRDITGQDQRRGLNMKLVGQLSLPIPPVAEQRRIVAKVDELMALCDRLEAQQQERETRHAALARASLARFAEAPTPANLDFLFHKSYSISPADLRKSILTLAIQGKLVRQDPNDEPAYELLARIEDTKQSQIEQRTLKRVPITPDLDDNAVESLPPGWLWTRLGSAFDVRDGTHDTPKYTSEGYPLITSKNIYSGRLLFDGANLISEKDHRQISERSRVDKGDILFAMIGSIGNPVIVDTDREFSIKNVALFKYYSAADAEPRFLLQYLKLVAGEMKARAAGGVQSFVSLGYLRNYPFPLPPLAEQRRIVAKVDELMDLVDTLEAQLATAHNAGSQLVDAVVAELTQGCATA
jgi:type I restriction enzyme S subunit